MFFSGFFGHHWCYLSLLTFCAELPFSYVVKAPLIFPIPLSYHLYPAISLSTAPPPALGYLFTYLFYVTTA